jgi:hypothetical protein
LIEFLKGDYVIPISCHKNQKNIRLSIEKLTLNGYLNVNEILDIESINDNNMWINTLKLMVAINPVDRLPCFIKMPMSYKHTFKKFNIPENFTPHEYFEGISWMFDAAKTIRLTNTVLFDAIDLMNRYYTIKSINRDTYSQINIASMIISIKINDSDIRYIDQLIGCIDCENGSVLSSEIDIVTSLLPDIIPYHAHTSKGRDEVFNIYKTICVNRNQYPQQSIYNELISI